MRANSNESGWVFRNSSIIESGKEKRKKCWEEESRCVLGGKVSRDRDYTKELLVAVRASSHKRIISLIMKTSWDQE